MLFIGDVHGRMGEYRKICSNHKESIQLGDLSNSYRVIGQMMPPLNHRFIRGNHDPRSEIVRIANWIPDGTMIGEIMCIGGAAHVLKTKEPDRQIRSADWPYLLAEYSRRKPRIMATHDCPTAAGRIMDREDYEPNRTGEWLQQLLEIHVPDLWVFGHWHQSRSFNAEGCAFRCLDLMECFTF